MKRLEMKDKAKDVIKGKVLFSFLVIFIYGVLISIPDVFLSFAKLGDEYSVLISIGSLIAFIGTIFLYPIRYGVILYFHDISNGRDGKLEGFFTPYKEKFWQEMIKARLLANFYIFLGTICLIIPGIYLALKYSQIEYCFLENKQIKYKEAMDKSAEIMKNNKMELFILGLSFFGWVLLIPLTLGFISIYLAPYMEATALQFYYAKSGFSVSPEVIIIDRDEAEKRNTFNDDPWKN
ncbi:MAG TPA: DUF975 family protein [Clostridia bacterium]|jgi:uncharacterized membrane protein|nr:DUF975 family protein [Clostridia bacterium]